MIVFLQRNRIFLITEVTELGRPFIKHSQNKVRRR